MKTAVASCLLVALYFTLVHCETKQCFIQNSTTSEPYDNSVYQCCEELGIQPIRDGTTNKTIHCCGNETFNELVNICCNKKVHSILQDNLVMDCCGGQTLFSKDTDICCDGQVYPIKSDNKSSERCCKDESGNYSPQTWKKNYDCCGPSYYNMTTHHCAKNFGFNPPRDTVLPVDQDICNGTIYNYDSDLCCTYIQGHGDEILYKNVSMNARCCGKSVHSNKTEQCCFNTFTAPIKSTCCGNSYALDYQRCCNDKVMNASATQECCFEQLYDKAGGEDCCSGRVYNASLSRCCGSTGKVIPIQNECYGTTTQTSPAYNKCGQEVYDEINDRCCNYKLHKKVEKRMKCCGASTKLYDTKLQDCRNSVVYPKLMTTTVESGYGICNFCRWTEEDFLIAMEKGEINICQKEAMGCRVSGRVKFDWNQMKFKVLTKQSLFNPDDHWAKSNTMKLHVPCKCSKIGKGHHIFVITNTPLTKKNIRLGDSDVLVLATPNIKKELVKQKLLCNLNRPRF